MLLHVQFNPLAFVVSDAAKRAKCSPRIEELAQPRIYKWTIYIYRNWYEKKNIIENPHYALLFFFMHKHVGALGLDNLPYETSSVVMDLLLNWRDFMLQILTVN